MNNIAQIREYRHTIYTITDFILKNEKAVVEFGSSLNWQDLESIPTWLLWDEQKIENLVMTAGTIFLLPSIRIWIDSKKIQEVRQLIGEQLFDFILETTKVENTQGKMLNIGNVKEHLLSSGSAVVISSNSMRIRPWLNNILPRPKGKLDPVLASEIMKHTIFVLHHTSLKREG
jgi:hypothetical protein